MDEIADTIGSGSQSCQVHIEWPVFLENRRLGELMEVTDTE